MHGTVTSKYSFINMWFLIMFSDAMPSGLVGTVSLEKSSTRMEEVSSLSVLVQYAPSRLHGITTINNNIYLLQVGCHPVAVVILHVHKT